MTEKCDKCRRWPLGCELDGDFRRGCIKMKYIYFKPLKCEYLTKDDECNKRAPCDENYDDLMACPACHPVDPEELPKPYKPKFVDLNKKRKINPGWMQ